MGMIPIADYRPDVSDFLNQYSDDVTNVFPALGCVIPAKNFAPMNLSLPIHEVPLGAIAVRHRSGISFTIFLGTETKIFALSSLATGWIDVTKPDTVYNASVENPWSFAAWGQQVIITNGNDPPQTMLVTDDHMRDLGEKPILEGETPYTVKAPLGSIVKIWGNFVAIMGLQDGSLVDTSGKEPVVLLNYNSGMIIWSGLNDPDRWNVGDPEYFSDWQEFFDGGNVHTSSETSNPIIFLDTAIYYGTFMPGSVEIFRFQKVQEKRGARNPISVASRGEQIFYADAGGFFMITAEAGFPVIEAIGFEKVDRTYFQDLSSIDLDTIKGVIDPFYNRVYWGIDSNSNGIYDMILSFDWLLKKWTVLELDTPIYDFVQIYTFGVSLEEMDAFETKGTDQETGQFSDKADLDRLPYSLDARIWKASSPVLMGIMRGISGRLEIGAFHGQNMEARVTTYEVGETGQNFFRLGKIRIISDANEIYLSAGRRNTLRLRGNIHWTSESTPSDRNDNVYIRSRAKFHRFKVRIPANTDWTYLDGVDVELIPSGRF
ncbi:MAG: hypothetical protein JSC085_000995 [Candidatus Tokpelaia sp. JSC085]|nr:MAG: hypothetical protein JSC085_000995 [Candidatus Tokpelaia sp. JSC085]